MTDAELKEKNVILINYLQSIISDFKFKAEYSTNDNDKEVIVVQEQMGVKTTFYGDIPPLFNYYSIQIFGSSIAKCKETSVVIGNLIGKSVLFQKGNKTWQIIFQQFSNPQAIEYYDIRRVGYTATLKCIVNLCYRTQ
jgi:hypothetical protein